VITAAQRFGKALVGVQFSDQARSNKMSVSYSGLLSVLAMHRTRVRFPSPALGGGRGSLFPCPFEASPSPASHHVLMFHPMDFSWWRRDRHDEDDIDESIIDALHRTQPTVWAQDQVVTVNPQTMPIAHVNPTPPPNPPSRHARPELHITGPQPARPTPAPQFIPAPGRALRADRDTLPVFRDTTRVMGWAAAMRSSRPLLDNAWAIRTIHAYSDRSYRWVCQQYEQARGELWERARDYDMVETEHRARYPLAKQIGM
jgi:hypothetical protein